MAAAWLAFAVAPPAYAQDYAAAGRHVAAAKEAYGKGAFVAAAEEYAKAYDLAKDPVLLANVAECNERSGKLDLAVKNYRQYLADAPGATDRGEIEKRIAELQKKLAAPTAVPVPAPSATPTAAVAAPVPVAAAPVGATGANSAPAKVETAPNLDKAAPEKNPEEIWKEADEKAAAARRAFEAKLAASSSAKLKGKAAKKALAEVAAAEADWKVADTKAEEARQAAAAWKLEMAKQAEEAKRADERKRAETARRAEEARLAAAAAATARKAEETRRAEEEARRVAEAKRLADLGPPITFPIDDRGTKYRTAGWITVAATVALLGTGIVFGLVAQDRSDEVSRRLGAVEANGQPPVFDAATKQQMSELKHDGQTYNAVAIGLLSAAGLTAIASVILFAVDHRVLTRAEKRVQIAPSFASGRAGVAAGFLF